MSRTELGAFEYQVLAVVRDLEGEGFGAEIARQIEQRAGRLPSPGQLYSALDRIEAKRLVLVSWAKPEPVRGGKAKRLYRLSASGKRMLADFERQMRSFAAVPLAGATA